MYSYLGERPRKSRREEKKREREEDGKIGEGGGTNDLGDGRPC